jgi:hypothetical protein
MKVSKSVTMEIDVDVDISLEDITYAIKEDMDSPEHITRGINNVWVFLSAIPDADIKAMPAAKRKTIFDALNKQIQRFAPGDV